MAKIIDGKAVSSDVRLEVKTEVEKLKKQGVVCTLAVIIVGDDPASRVYVNNKKKACAEIGIESLEYALSEKADPDELYSLIRTLNDDPGVNGILVQLPLPRGFDEEKVIDLIRPEKDVDAFTKVNVGKIMLGKQDFLPCTPAGIMCLLERYDVDVCGKECVVIGRSNIVGKPMAMLLLQQNGTVTVAHSRTCNLREITKRADILIVAIGKPEFVTADMVKEGAVVIDVGINRNSEGKLCGDVAFSEVSKKASLITPVPGGVGPMTIAMLMKNTLKAALLQNNL